MDLNHAHSSESITAPVTSNLLAMTTLLPGLTATFGHLVAGISQPCHPMAKLSGPPFMISSDPVHPFALISVFSKLGHTNKLILCSTLSNTNLGPSQSGTYCLTSVFENTTT